METKPTHESRLIISYWHLFAPVLFLAVFVLIAPWLPFFTEHRGEDYWYLFLVICLGFSGCLWVGLPIVSQTFSFSKAGIEHCTLFFFSHQYKWEDVHYVIHLYTGDTLQTKSILIMPKGSFCCLPTGKPSAGGFTDERLDVLKKQNRGLQKAIWTGQVMCIYYAYSIGGKKLVPFLLEHYGEFDYSVQ